MKSVALTQLLPFFSSQFVMAAQRKIFPSRALCFDGTVAVVDLKGFSAKSAYFFDTFKDEHSLLAYVNHFYKIVLEVGRQSGCFPFSFDGDALSMVFAGSNHADAACDAASAILEALASTEGEFGRMSASIGLGSGNLFIASCGQKNERIPVLLGQTAIQVVQAQKSANGPGIATASIEPPSPKIGLNWSEKLQENDFPCVEALDDSELRAFLLEHIPVGLEERWVSDRAFMVRRPIAALFVNVDKLSEWVDAAGENALDGLNLFFTKLQTIIRKYGGFLNKVNSYVTGDKYLVLFGITGLHCDDPGRSAIFAACELQNIGREFPVLLRQRMGISLGLASECLVGDDWRCEFTVLGRPVNESVHLMAMADWEEIVVLGEWCLFTPPAGWSVRSEKARLKGYSDPSEIYRFTNLKRYPN